MKILILTVVMILLSGCITMTPCHYCGQTTYPTYERNQSYDLDDGFVKTFHSKVWVEVKPKKAE